ncbi:MAG: OmpA family protein [Fibrobacterota bacterium]
MKKLSIVLALMLTVGMGVSQAQIVTETWIAGSGLSFPRFYSVNITALNSDYGVYLAVQRNLSANIGLRLKGAYSHLEGEWADAASNKFVESTGLITGDLDLLYYLVPCARLSPYLFAGLGANYKMVTNAQPTFLDDTRVGSQLNIGVGNEFKLKPQWSIVAEFGFHITSNSALEGTIVPAEMNGRDSYLVLSAGVNYFFGKGKPSKLCDPCCSAPAAETKDLTDYAKIEDLIVKHIPKEVVKEITTKEMVVDRYIMAISKDRLVLVGVNFAFDKSDLLPESHAVLDKSVKLLNDKPSVKFEVEGYTDYVGSDEYNQELSVERAQVVKAYLVSKGIAQNRLTCVGFGKNNPLTENDTAAGRAMNRRIVFKIIK